MRSIALSLIAILVIAIVLVLIGVLAYRKRVRRVENGEIRDTHSSIPAPETTVNGVYKIVLMIVVVITLLHTSALRGEISSLKQDLNNQNSLIWQIEHRIDTLLDEKNSRLLSFAYEFGSVDFDKKTGELSIVATLKEFSEDTVVTVEAGTNRFELKKTTPGTYAATIDYGLFEPYSEAHISINEGGKTILETIDFPSPTFYEYLPVPSLNSTFSARTTFGKMKYNGEFYFTADHLEDVASVTLTYMTANRDIQTTDITKEFISGEMIAVVKGMPVEQDLSARIEIVTKSGFRIIQQTVMIYDSDSEGATPQFLEIQDLNGSTLWNAEY